MKFTAIVAALGLALPAAQAVRARISGTPITDPVRLAELKARHDAVIEAFKARNSSTADGLDERKVPMAVNAVFAGFYLVAKLGAILGAFDDISSTLFPGWENDPIWDSDDYCRTYYKTHGGGSCEVEVWVRDDDDLYESHSWDGCSWIDPGSGNDPPIQYYEDEGIGEYSVQFTATDSYTWDGIDNTEECVSQGICNPQYIFYRKDFELVLNPWESEGSTSDCQYFGTENCGGLCITGVSDQFSTGGNRLFGDCAIPCANEGVLPPTR